MSKEMVISANPHETRVAILEEGQLCEFYVEREKEFALVGSIYKGRVTRVLPGMQSAFVEIGLDSDAFLYVSDFLEDLEEFDHIVTTAEDKVQKMQDQGGQVFSATTSSAPALEPADVDSAPVSPSEHLSVEQSAESFPSADSPVSTESFAPSGNVAPISNVPPRHNGPPANRPRFENRSDSRPNRGGGRDFRGGRGGRRGGRSNRGGPGGGRGGDRRYGRELPQSKYASHRPHDDSPIDSAPPDSSVPIILPGESLAKYKAPSSASSVTPPESAPPLTPASFPPEPTRDSLSPAPPPETEHSDYPAAPSQSTSRSSFDASSRSSSYSSSTGFEPLPGESVAKWKNRETPAEQHSEHSSSSHETGASTSHESSAALDDAETEIAHFEHQAETAPSIGHDDVSHPELSEDEAAALAEHVAEAQSEAADRHAERENSIAATDLHVNDEVHGELHGGVHEDAHEDAHESSHETLHEEFHGTLQDDREADDTIADVEEHELEMADSESDADAEADEAHDKAHDEAHAHAEADSETLAAASADTEQSDSAHLDAAPAENGSPISSESQPAQERPPYNARVQNDYRSRMQNPARRGGRDRGGRPDRGRPDRGRRPQHGPGGHGHRTPPRRTQLIADLLKQGQEIIVQIAKEPLGKKGARITSHVALPGRFLVYMPTLDHTGVSRKIASAEDRARLRHLVNEAKGQGGGGFIVRTAAGSATAEEVKTDVEFLMRTWQEIKSRSEQRKAPAILHRDLNLVERILRDYITPDFGAIWVDSEEEFAKVVEFMSRFQPALVGRVKLYTKETPVFEEFGIQQEIDKGLRPKVWLKSGGYIVINHTEALVAIDVNTGKFVGKGSNRLEDTIVRTNLEAVKEVVRQMRLRDLGGIIIIDFIDMEERRNREKVMAALEDALRADRAPSKVLRFNEFGLVAITRKRTKQALERTLCQPCPYCTGSGMVKSIPTLCYEIQAEARKMAPEVDSGSLTLRLHPEIAKALKTRESSLIEELERWTKKSIIIQADPTLHWEQYDIY
jgi:Rne/Rng family ribonuclease